MTVYERVKLLADEQKKPISAIEVEAGISNGTISGWKSGRPYAETLQKVSKVLGCTIESLLGDSAADSPEE